MAESGEVDFSEMANRAIRSLGHENAPSDLALRLDYRIQHLLVDEFQDTSFSQVHLLDKLTAGWSDGDGRTLFLVGDPMQSIYRFRKAEVSLFIKAWQGRLFDHIRLSAVAAERKLPLDPARRGLGQPGFSRGDAPAKRCRTRRRQLQRGRYQTRCSG